jgi:hypothetical protein
MKKHQSVRLAVNMTDVAVAACVSSIIDCNPGMTEEKLLAKARRRMMRSRRYNGTYKWTRSSNL